MKATDLRIGNFVEILGKIETVVDVMCDSVNTTTCEGVTYDMVNAVPLTSKWLEKFGFEIKKSNRDDHYRLKKTYLSGYFYKRKGFYFKNIYCDIKYVHQLQNLYRALTGEELQLTNENK